MSENDPTRREVRLGMAGVTKKTSSFCKGHAFEQAAGVGKKRPVIA
jgi:hypothetical protein